MRINNLVELIHNSILNMFMIDINFSRAELARRDAFLEQDVQLGERAAAGLGEAEVGVDDAEEADDGPEEAGVILPVPLLGVEHVRGDDAGDDGNDEATEG